MTMRMQVVFIWCRWATVVLMVASCVSGCSRGSITIKHNGYRNVLIAIGENIEENPALVPRIKELFTQASAFLYNATRQRAFFQEITILVPRTWSNSPQYIDAGEEAIDKSDIQIDSSIDEILGHEPFTLRQKPCGQLGHYIALTPEYLLNVSIARKHGPYDKVLVHEWAHFRYGVFDEYPPSEGPFFYNTGGKSSGIQPAICSAKLQGEMYDKETGGKECSYEGSLPNENCRFRLKEDAQQSPGHGSLMFASYLNHVTEFCDNDPLNPLTEHNAEVDSRQNRMCNGKSVWEVLREHDDFRTANPPRVVTSTVPQFTVVRPGVRRTVLVLDVSGSMKEEIGKLGKGCFNFINNSRDGEKLAIVTFSTSGVALKTLTVISTQTRAELARAIPKEVDGGTSIGAGLRKALEVLRQDGSPRGASLIVVSDGDETDSPRIADVLPEIRASGVTVHTLAFTDNADSSLDSLAQTTRGLAFLYSNVDRSNALFEAFSAFLEFNIERQNRRYTLGSNAFPLVAGTKESAIVVIDDTLGRNTEFVIDYSGDDVTFTIESPVGNIYHKNSPQVVHDSNFGIYRLTLNLTTSKYGPWRYTINNEQMSTQKVSVSVSSQSQAPGRYPIIAQAFWGHKALKVEGGGTLTQRQNIYASVSKGYSPVLYANVVAEVECPNGSIVKTTLSDKGAGADQTKDDGIYSSYFTQFCGNGRYSLKVSVNNSDVTVVSPVRIVGQGAPISPRLDVATPRPDIPVKQLQRVAAGGSFSLILPVDTASGSVIVPQYPPGRVTDLRVTSVDITNKSVHLAWTAVGAQLDQGTVTEYVLRMATNVTALRQSFDSQTAVSGDMVSWGNLSNPAPPDHPETLHLTLPRQENVTYFFALAALDRRRRDERGDVSNIVSAAMTSYEALNPTTPASNGGGCGQRAGAGLLVVSLTVMLWSGVRV